MINKRRENSSDKHESKSGSNVPLTYEEKVVLQVSQPVMSAWFVYFDMHKLTNSNECSWQQNSSL